MNLPPSRLTSPALRAMLQPYLRRLGADHHGPRLRVIWNTRLRTAIGRTDPARARIYLNPRLMDRYPQELLPTLVHEMCHVVAGLAAGHGPRWKRLMLQCGFPAETHHDLDVSEFASRRRTWRWRCQTCEEIYVRKSRAARHYRCGRCRGVLRVEQEVATAARNARRTKPVK